MSDKENVPHDIVELLIKEVTGTIKDLGSDIETCSTNIVQLTSKVDASKIGDVTNKVDIVERKIDNVIRENDALKEALKETKKTMSKVEHGLFKTIPRTMMFIFLVISGFSSFIVYYKMSKSVGDWMLQSNDKTSIIQQSNNKNMEILIKELQNMKTDNMAIEGTLNDLIKKYENKNTTPSDDELYYNIRKTR
jgi:hypothetical protein